MAGELLAKLVPDIQKTADLVQEISSASAEQNSGSQQINKAIQQMDQVVQQNESYAEEMASTGEELSSQSEHLQDIMGVFKVNGNGTIKQAAHERTREVATEQTAPSPASRGGSAAHNRPAGKIKTAVKKAGVAINMGNGGKDSEDEEFERY